MCVCVCVCVNMLMHKCRKRYIKKHINKILSHLRSSSSFSSSSFTSHRTRKGCLLPWVFLLGRKFTLDPFEVFGVGGSAQLKY